jgi:5-methylthioadenosine/S-adenosylhomocysteine deaminase
MRIRAQIAHKVYDADLGRIGDGVRTFNLDEGLARLQTNIDLHDQWHGGADGRIQIRFGAHAADTCSPELQTRIHAEASSRGAGVHTHAAQSNGEVDYIQSRFGCSSLQLLQRQGLLGPSTIAAHVLFAPDEDITLLAETSTRVAHCPSCVAKVAAAIGPFRRIYDAGIDVGWGTDWVSMDPWDCMRMGIICLRLVEGDELLLSARDALWRFTLGAATILGLQDTVGSLEPGKKADLILVDVDQPHLAPLYDPIPTLVYNASGRDVTHTMIDGKFVVQDRRLVHHELREILANARQASDMFWRSAGPSVERSLPAFSSPVARSSWQPTAKRDLWPANLRRPAGEGSSLA